MEASPIRNVEKIPTIADVKKPQPTRIAAMILPQQLIGFCVACTA
jgi:hypothetical protein